MFDFVKRLFKRSQVEESEVNPFIDGNGREWMLGHPGEPSRHPSTFGGPVMQNVGRDPADILRACDIKKCVRPSIATILTYDQLDVDIPDATGNKLRGTVRLPIYNEYRLCDRCYKKYGRGIGTKFVVTSHPVYNPDKHAQTQKKLATKTRKTSK